MLKHPLYAEDLRRALSNAGDLSSLKDSAFLVTGATGMIGTALIDMLLSASRAEGLNLRIYANARKPERITARFGAEPEVTPFACDISMPDKPLPQVDYIVHAGANAHPLAYSTDPVGTMRGNFLGTLKLLEHARICGAKRLLLISSSEVYGQDAAKDEHGTAETDFGYIDPMLARSCYPESKRAAETLCAAYIRQYGVDSVAVRPAYIYGPTLTTDNSRADAQFLRNVLAGEDIVLKSTGSAVRTYCHVADTASAILTVLLRGETGCAYNIGDRDSVVSIREYAQTLADCAGVSLRFDLPPETERQGYSTVTRAVVRTDRLEALGWKPSLHLREGLAHTYAILSNH
jgi:Nucleoside-diphosphate-sugar epimerases